MLVLVRLVWSLLFRAILSLTEIDVGGRHFQFELWIVAECLAEEPLVWLLLLKVWTFALAECRSLFTICYLVLGESGHLVIYGGLISHVDAPILRAEKRLEVTILAC